MFKKIEDCKVGDELYCIGVDDNCDKVTISEINFYHDKYTLKFTNGCVADGSIYDTKTRMGMYACVCYTTKEEALMYYIEKVTAIQHYKEKLLKEL